jgi:long-chain acyl-CoA synthetase
MNLAQMVTDSAEGYPGKPALVFQGRSISYEDLDELVDRTAAALTGLGMVRGDRVAMVAGNVPEFVSCFYGVLRAGGVVCPLNVQLTPEEVGYILADAGAKIVIAEAATAPTVLAVRDRLADLETILVIGGPPAPARTISLEEALATNAEPPDLITMDAEPAVIAYTSGTTAAPKGAVLTHGSLHFNIDQMNSITSLAVSSDDVTLLALPLFHIYGLNVGLGMSVKAGGTGVLVDRFDPLETLRLIERHGITVVPGAPPMYAAWLALADAEVEIPDLSSVRLAVSGAARLPPDLLERFRTRFGIPIWEGYGLTEASPSVTSSAAGREPKPGSIGPPLPGVDVRLVDEHGQDVDEDDPGEILVRGPNVFAGYWNRPDATQDAFEEGWLRTGDVAYQDEDGYLFLVDRKKDVIIVSGFNVWPKEIEDAIERHPSVAEAAVVGIPDERTGEAIQAWVVPGEGKSVTPDDVRMVLYGYLAKFKWPKEIHVVDELPHHVTGKVLRRMLRGEEMLGQAQEAGGAEVTAGAAQPAEGPEGAEQADESQDEAGTE